MMPLVSADRDLGFAKLLGSRLILLIKKQLLIDELIEDADNEPTLFQRIQLANWRGRRSILLIDGLVPGRF